MGEKKIDILKHKSIILNSINKTDWDFGNNILYKLCHNFPRHERKDIVIAKILFIGRIYSAAIERRKNKEEKNDYFYVKKVAPKLINSELDFLLSTLNKERDINEKNILNILKVHSYLTDLFKELTNLSKRSLSSKYLHFHFPKLFFIYDTRTVNALRKFNLKELNQLKSSVKLNEVDKEYGKFFIKSLVLKKEIEKKLNIEISVRQFDKFLIELDNID